MRGPLKSLLSSAVFKVNRTLNRNFVRPLTQQQVTKPHQETLTGRLLLYLNTEKGKETPNSTPNLLKDAQQRNQLFKLNTGELVSLSGALINEDLRDEAISILHQLDSEYCARLPELSSADIFKLLNVCMSVAPGKITRLSFYRRSIKVLYKSLPKLSSNELLQLVFYIGLTKKTRDSQEMLKHCMWKMDKTFIANLTSEELCLICNATFKTSTKITKKELLEKVRSYINCNLSVLSDIALFVTLIKTLRHNRYQNEDLLNTIICAILFNKTLTLYSFPVNCHILALFADSFFYDVNFFKLMTKKCVDQISESSYVSRNLHPSKQLRGKDIKRFLWIMSMFSEMKLLSQSDIKNVIIPKLIERIKIGEFAADVDSLVDIFLFLWMLNYRALELVPYLFTPQSWRLLKIAPKTKLRLNLLLQAISIEDPDLLKEVYSKPLEAPTGDYSSDFQLKKRPLIQRLLKNLQNLRVKLNLDKFEFSQDIPHLNIVGITGYGAGGKKSVHVEVLDDYTRIRNVDEDVPVGLMALKLRLLDQSEEGVLVVSQREVEEMTDAELNEFLLDELKLVC